MHDGKCSPESSAFVGRDTGLLTGRGLHELGLPRCVMGIVVSGRLSLSLRLPGPQGDPVVDRAGLMRPAA